MRSSLYEHGGGAAAFRALAAAHHERCLRDPLLNHPFSHDLDPQHVEHLGAYWAEVFGGPPTFSGSRGGHSAMLRIHAECEAPAEMGERFVACFLGALDDAGLPTDPDFRNALRGYIEWATAEVMACAPRGSVVKPGQPMPRWSWDGLQPAR